jgi:hypothetical protein
MILMNLCILEVVLIIFSSRSNPKGDIHQLVLEIKGGSCPLSNLQRRQAFNDSRHSTNEILIQFLIEGIQIKEGNLVLETRKSRDPRDNILSIKD